MKKILTTLALSGFAAAAFAQGYVAWNVSPAGDIIVATNAANYSSLAAGLGGGAATGQAGGVQGNAAGLAGNVYYFQLLYSTVDTTTPTSLTDLANNWTASSLQMQNLTTANNGRLTELNGASAAAIDPSYNGTGNLQLMLVGWSANLGTSYTGANGVLSDLQNWSTASAGISGAAYFGLGFVGTSSLSTSSSTGTTIWSATQTAGGLISNPSASPMVLYELAVPEPGTMALAALGGASLLLFRRKK